MLPVVILNIQLRCLRLGKAINRVANSGVLKIELRGVEMHPPFPSLVTPLVN